MSIISQVAEIDRAYLSLSEQLRYIEARYQTDKSKIRKGLKILEQAKQVFADDPPRRGYVAHLVPILQRHGGVMKLRDMLTELHRQEGFQLVTLESLEAVLSSELRNQQPRVQRVGPRVYALARREDIILTPKTA